MNYTKDPNQTIRLERRGDSREVERLWLEGITIGYIVSGKMALHTPRGIVQLYAGELFVLPEGAHLVEYQTTEDRLYEEILFTVSRELLSTILRELQLFADLPRPSRPTLPTNHIAHQRAGRTLTSFMAGVRSYLAHDIFFRCGTMARMKTNELIYLLLSDGYDELSHTLGHLATLRRESLERFAERNILSRKPLAELAAEYGMSLSNFKKAFREELGQTPHRWFMARRLELAARLLISSDEQVKAVAHECGFTSPSHFIRLFHARYSLTPVEYRARNTTPPADSHPALPLPKAERD